MKRNRALVVVEKDFFGKHVGVRRVILYMAAELEKAGFAITLAFPENSGLTQFELSGSFTELERRAFHTGGAMQPFWCTRTPPLLLSRIQVKDHDEHAAGSGLRIGARLVEPSEFELSIVSNPWLVKAGLPSLNNVVGIVYDVIPNLLAMGALTFLEHVEVYQFAHEHAIGFDYYNRYARELMFISDSSKADYYSLFEKPGRTLPVGSVLIPYRSQAQPSTGQRSEGDQRAKKTVLAVNLLDPRKNFERGIEALERLAKSNSFDLVVVGQERMPLHAVMRSLKRLEQSGVGIAWFRNASDELLTALYQNADVLFFPSVYEGLGLPILEAQDVGLPVVSTNHSSCGAINMLRELTTSYQDVEGFEARLRSVLTGEARVPARAELSACLRGYLGKMSSIERLETVRHLMQPTGRAG